ncbi:MAG: hypothetical protein ACI8WT_003666 [Clostridium sp.]|jgi:hypothetical protein
MDFNPNEHRQKKREIPFLSDGNNKRQSKGETSIGIKWGEVAEMELEEDEEFIEVTDNVKIINTVVEPLNDHMLIGNKKVNIVKFQPKEKVEDTEKLTIYLPKSLISTLKLLKDQKSIVSCSQCVKFALVDYLTT